MIDRIIICNGWIDMLYHTYLLTFAVQVGCLGTKGLKCSDYSVLNAMVNVRDSCSCRCQVLSNQSHKLIVICTFNQEVELEFLTCEVAHNRTPL